MSEMKWRSINTAPKDGSEIDLWVDDRRIADCCWRVPSSPKTDWPREKADWCYYHVGWCEWVEIGEEPTHWLLVTPPSTNLLLPGKIVAMVRENYDT